MVEVLEELYLQVNGGQVRVKNKEKRSVEPMISNVFKPESYSKISEDKNVIESMHVVAPALNDYIHAINILTIKAVQKEGLSKDTVITAFCMVQPIVRRR